MYQVTESFTLLVTQNQGLSLQERVDEDQELNVMNSGDESGDEIMRESPT